MSSQVDEEINSFESNTMVEDVAGTNHDDQSDVIAELPSTVEEPSAQQPSTTPAWGDSEDTPGTLQLFSDAEDISVPLVLRSLVASSGARFVHVPQSIWSIDGFSARLQKNCSVCFSMDIEITSAEIVDGFEGIGIEFDTITSVQRRASNKSWVVTFKKPETKLLALKKGHLTIKDVPVFLSDPEHRIVNVKIYEAPDELPDTVIIGRLSCFGKILSFRRDRGPVTGIRNGIRTARMHMTQHIPSTLSTAGETILISYLNQPKSCRRCGSEDHMANGCRQPRCFNCHMPGHRSSECEQVPMCGVCLSVNHPLSSCPYVIFSANVSDPSHSPSRPFAEAAAPRTIEQEEAIRTVKETMNGKTQSNKQHQKRSSKETLRDREDDDDGRRKNRDRDKDQEKEDRRRNRDDHRDDRRDRERRRRDRERDRDSERVYDDRDYRREDRDRSHSKHRHYSNSDSDSEYELVRKKKSSRR